MPIQQYLRWILKNGLHLVPNNISNNAQVRTISAAHMYLQCALLGQMYGYASAPLERNAGIKHFTLCSSGKTQYMSNMVFYFFFMWSKPVWDMGWAPSTRCTSDLYNSVVRILYPTAKSCGCWDTYTSVLATFWA